MGGTDDEAVAVHGRADHFDFAGAGKRRRGGGGLPPPRCQFGDILQVEREVRWRSRRPDDTALRERLKALAEERRRFGYRRLHVLLRREGHLVNRKRVQRLYHEEKLMVRRRGGRKRALGARRPPDAPRGPNQRWSLDFVSDQLTNGRRFRILTVVDDFTRECLIWLPTRRCRVRVSHGNWTNWCADMGAQRRSSVTMAPN